MIPCPRLPGKACRSEAARRECHGKARFERYGGVDPGKGVDNDFAAVLIRAYDATGEVERAAANENNA